MSNSTNNELDPKFFKKLRVFHAIFCFLLALSIIVIIVFNSQIGENVLNRNDNTLFYVAIAITLLFPVISNYVFYQRVDSIDLDEAVKLRFSEFLNANVLRYLWLLGAGVLNMVIWFFTANILIAILTGFLLLIFLLIRPNKFKVIGILRLRPPK